MSISKSLVTLMLLLLFGKAEEQDAAAMEILHNALERQGEIQSYQSEIAHSEQYSTKERDQVFYTKFQQKFVEDVGLHQVTEHTSGEITEWYVLKKELYGGDFNPTINATDWGEPELLETEEMYFYYLSQLHIYWDLESLLSIEDVRYNYLANDDEDLHKIIFKYEHKDYNDEPFENLLLTSGIYISPFIGKGSFSVEGTILIDKITSDLSSIVYSVEYNRFNPSEHEYNKAEIQVEILNSQFNGMDTIFPPKVKKKTPRRA